MKTLSLLIFSFFTFWSKDQTNKETPLKYDIEVELDKFVIANVRDLDGTEDLFGYVKCLKPNNEHQDKMFWEYLIINQRSYRNGTQVIDKRIKIISNLSKEALLNFNLKVQADISDAETQIVRTDPMIWNKFECQECNDDGIRQLKFNEMPTTTASINNLINNGQYQQLRFGEDNYFELNFYEKGVKNNGWVKMMWKVWVKPHQ